MQTCFMEEVCTKQRKNQHVLFLFLSMQIRYILTASCYCYPKTVMFSVLLCFLPVQAWYLEQYSPCLEVRTVFHLIV